MTAKEEPRLAERMRALADKHTARAVELYDYASALDAATDGFFAEPPTHDVRQFVGAWARARKLWADITKEPLV